MHEGGKISSQPAITEAQDQDLRQSERERRPPDFYGVRVNITSEALNEPTSIAEALSSPDKAKWKDGV